MPVLSSSLKKLFAENCDIQFLPDNLFHYKLEEINLNGYKGDDNENDNGDGDDDDVEVLSLSLGSGPEGVDDLCFHTYGEFSPLGRDLGLEDGIWAPRLGSVPPGQDFGL